MPRRRRSFFFNNKHKKLLTNTTDTVKTTRTAAAAGLELEGYLDTGGYHIDMGTNNITDTKVGQWDTAYGWGNHASAGYSTTNYSNSDVDSHLNQSNPTSGYVLSWNGSDYAWVAQSAGFSGNYNDLTNQPSILLLDEGSYTGDLDNLTAGSDQGFYHWGSTQPTNGPGWNYGGLFVVRDNNQNIQLAIGNSGSGAQRLAIRRADGGSYSGNAWTEFWSTADFSATKVQNWDTAYGWGNHASAGYLTSFDITTQTDAKYLRSDTSDTASGQLTLTYSTNPTLHINSAANEKILLSGSTQPYIRWQESSTDKAYIQWKTSGFLQLVNQEDLSILRIRDNLDFTTDYSVGTYYSIWHAGNDGSGSGLDADLLDGQHGSYYSDYNNLSNKPTIPTNNNQLTNGAGYAVRTASNFSGTYNIPVVVSGSTLYYTPSAGGVTITGSSGQITTPSHGNSSQWNTAYGWGNHASAGYITSTVSGDIDIVGDVKAAGQIRATGWWNTNSSDRSGYAVEIGWSGGEGYLLSYSRTAGAYGAMNYSATSHDFINGNVRIKTGKILELESSSGNLRGYIQGTETNDQHLIIATTGGEDIAFKDGGVSGVSNLIVRGDGNIWVRGSILNGTMAYSQLTGTPTIPTNNNQLTNGAGYITNGSSYNVNNAWLRENGDNADVKLYGNTRQMTFRTDGVNGGTGGHTGYPFRWTYGGDAAGNSKMLLNTSGQLWLENYGWLHGAFLRKDTTDTQTNTINMNGYFVGGADGHREKGIYGNYNSYRINNIWSMGTSYKVSSAGTGFGNLYGMAYTYHNRVYTSNTMGGYHQMVWCQNGSPNCALGSNIWTSGNVTAYSDIRVKENLEIIPNALEKVKKLNGYTFDRTDIETDNEGNTPRKRQTGVVAQEVLEVLPEVVTGNETNPDGHLSVAYGNMVGLLIEAIKEQQEQIEELKARLQ